MAGHTVTVRVSIAWWLRWYLTGVIATSWLTGLQPDTDMVAWWVRRAIRMRQT